MRAGAASVNASGRPPGARGLAAYVASCTRDGREIVDHLLRTMRDPSAPSRAIHAAELLLDRLCGRPMASHEIVALTANVEVGRLPPGFDTMTLDEKRAALAARRSAALARAAGAADLGALLPPGEGDDQ